MHNEIESLHENHTFELVELPKSNRALRMCGYTGLSKKNSPPSMVKACLVV